MLTFIRIIVIVAGISSGLAFARPGNGDEQRGHGDRRNMEGRNDASAGAYGAPEPYTLLGLGAGAGAAGYGAWRVRRNRE